MGGTSASICHRPTKPGAIPLKSTRVVCPPMVTVGCVRVSTRAFSVLVWSSSVCAENHQRLAGFTIVKIAEQREADSSVVLTELRDLKHAANGQRSPCWKSDL